MEEKKKRKFDSIKKIIICRQLQILISSLMKKKIKEKVTFMVFFKHVLSTIV